MCRLSVGLISVSFRQMRRWPPPYLRMLYPPILSGPLSGGLGHRLLLPIETQLGTGLWSIARAPL